MFSHHKNIKKEKEKKKPTTQVIVASFMSFKEPNMLVKGRDVHGSVRFGLDSKNQPNRIT